MTKLDAVDLQNKELNDLYDFEYNRRFPEHKDSIPTQFVRGLSRELNNPNSYANKGGSFTDGLGEGFVQGATDGYLREADKYKHEGMGDIYDIIADIKLQTQKLKADALNDQAAVNEKTKAIRQLAPSIRQLSEAKYAGDTNAEHDIGRGIFEMMKSMGMATGNYITTRDGTIIGEDENGVESMNINDLISQSGLSPEELFGDDAGNMMGMLSKGSKAKYEQAQAMSQAELDEKYAKADNLNAQAGKYNAEAGKIGYEMQSNTPEKAKIEESLNLQKDAMKDIYKARAEDSFYKSAMKEAENVLKEAEKSPDKYERVLPMRATDRDGKYIRYNKDQEALHAVGAEIKGAMFKRFKYRNQAEFENLPDLSPNKSVEQNIAALKIIQNTYARMVKEEDRSISNYEQLIESKYNPQQVSDFVIMRNQSTGEEMEVPMNKVELFKQNGYE